MQETIAYCKVNVKKVKQYNWGWVDLQPISTKFIFNIQIQVQLLGEEKAQLNKIRFRCDDHFFDFVNCVVYYYLLNAKQEITFSYQEVLVKRRDN